MKKRNLFAFGIILGFGIMVAAPVLVLEARYRWEKIKKAVSDSILAD